MKTIEAIEIECGTSLQKFKQYHLNRLLLEKKKKKKKKRAHTPQELNRSFFPIVQ